MKAKAVSILASAALVIFTMAAGAACYHQYLVQKGMLRTSRAVYIPPEFTFEEGKKYVFKGTAPRDSGEGNTV